MSSKRNRGMIPGVTMIGILLLTAGAGAADKALDIMREVENRALSDSQSYEGAIEVVDAAAQHGLGHVELERRLDALVAPTGGPAWTIDLVNGDHYVGGSSTAAAAHSANLSVWQSEVLKWS